MPWTVTQSPSIQLGILKPLLERVGLSVSAMHLYVDFFDVVAERLGDRRLSLDVYDTFGEFFGEWAFAVPPFRPLSDVDDSCWRELMAEKHSAAWIDTAFRVRSLVPQFLNRAADEILSLNPRVVGFSSTFHQTVPSLALARILRDRAPAIRIVFGGANCEGSMGEGLLRHFSWIDVVVRGEAERVAPRLFRELVDGRPVSPATGLCLRDGASIVAHGPAAKSSDRLTKLGRTEPELVAMDEVPLPVYDDFFDRAKRQRLGAYLTRRWLPYESARGCWWAVTKVCTFCAANATNTTFLSKSVERVRAEVLSLAERYQSGDVWFVDNIMDEQYTRELFPEMERHRDCDKLSMFVETRAHVSRTQLAAMRGAGVTMVQLGIESFSSEVLRIIDKGTTALQNIRVIKWCAELGIQAFYNVIYGFPGEPEAEYARMADLVTALSHLEAPNGTVPLRLDRFSPYHRDPDRYGIEIVGPRMSRKYAFNLDDDALAEIEYFFTFRYRDGRDPGQYAANFVDACAAWRRHWRADFGALAHRECENGLQIFDRRRGCDAAMYELASMEAQIYLGADGGVTAAALWQNLPGSAREQIMVTDVVRFLDQLVDLKLVYREGKKYLALSISVNSPGLAGQSHESPAVRRLSIVAAIA
jgi:ribosomal peptide maturation radical SAM protein 1